VEEGSPRAHHKDSSRQAIQLSTRKGAEQSRRDMVKDRRPGLSKRQRDLEKIGDWDRPWPRRPALGSGTGRPHWSPAVPALLEPTPAATSHSQHRSHAAQPLFTGERASRPSPGVAPRSLAALRDCATLSWPRFLFLKAPSFPQALILDRELQIHSTLYTFARTVVARSCEAKYRTAKSSALLHIPLRSSPSDFQDGVFRTSVSEDEA